MINSRLIKVLETFKDKEYKELELFLRSPLLTTEKKASGLLKLLAFISKAKPNYKEKSLKKKKAYAYVFNESKFVKGKLEKLMSSLFASVCSYLKWKYRQEDERLIPNWQPEIAFYKSRGLTNYQEKQLKKAENILKNPEMIDYNHHWHKLLLAHEWTDFSHISVPQNQIDHYNNEVICLDEYFLLRKLRIAVAVLALELQQKKKVQAEFISLEAILTQIDDEYLSNLPVHRVYICAYYFLKNFHQSDRTTFDALAEILEKEGRYLPFEKLQMLQTLSRIYVVGRLNKGDEDFLPIAFDLFKKHLAIGYLYFDNKIHSLTFMNLIIMGLKYNDFDWVRSFIETHENRILDKEEGILIINLSWGLFHFYKKEWNKALDYIPDNLNNIYYKLKARRLEIMIYYELRSVLLDSKMEAFKIYIFRLGKKEISEAYKLLNNHFIDLLRQILQPKTLGNTDRINKILNKIKTNPSVAEREWLIAKLGELKGE